jgi:hypothetical protein
MTARPDEVAQTYHELFQPCPVQPLLPDGSPTGEHDELSPGNEVAVVEERGDQVVLEPRGVSAARPFRFLARRVDLEHALTPPENMPRAGMAPTAPASTSGSPD